MFPGAPLALRRRATFDTFRVACLQRTIADVHIVWLSRKSGSRLQWARMTRERSRHEQQHGASHRYHRAWQDGAPDGAAPAKSRVRRHRLRHRCACMQRGAALRDRDRCQSRCGGANQRFRHHRRRLRQGGGSSLAGSRRHRRRRAPWTDRGYRVDSRAAHHGTARRSSGRYRDRPARHADHARRARGRGRAVAGHGRRRHASVRGVQAGAGKLRQQYFSPRSSRRGPGRQDGQQYDLVVMHLGQFRRLQAGGRARGGSRPPAHRADRQQRVKLGAANPDRSLSDAMGGEGHAHRAERRTICA